MSQSSRLKHILVKTARISLKIVLGLLALIIVLALLIQTSFVQNIIRGKAESWLQNKLHTTVKIGNLYVGFPKTIVIKDVYLEDRKKDTLFAGSRLGIDISLFKLLSHTIEVTDLRLDTITVKVTRQLPDTAFNFQYIIDAFNSGPKQAATASTPWNISVKDIDLRKFHIVYKDVVTGNDMDVQFSRFFARVNRLDLNKQDFYLSQVELEGLQAQVYQDEPLVKTVPSGTTAAAATALPTVKLDELIFTALALDYRNRSAGLQSQVHLGKLIVHPRLLDLNNNIIDIKNIILDTTEAVVLLTGKKPAAPKAPADTAKTKGWTFSVSNFDVGNNAIRFDDDSKTRQSSGMDFSHIDLREFSLSLQDFEYNTDSISGTITKGQMSEKSGFVLNQLHTRFLYANDHAFLHDLLVVTPGSRIQRSLSIGYGNIATISKHLGDLQMDIDMPESKIQVKDVLYFVPDLRRQALFANPGETWTIKGNVRGTLNKLQIPSLQVSGLSGTFLSASGAINGLPAVKNANGRIVINKFSSNRADLVRAVGSKNIPSSIRVPGQFTITGMGEGNGRNANVKLLLSSSDGGLDIAAAAQGYNDIKQVRYDIRAKTFALDLGKIMNDEKTYGRVSADFTVKGSGLDKQSADARVEGVVVSAVYKQYEYRDLHLDGNIAQHKIQLHARISDPNIDFDLQAKADITPKYPSVQVQLKIDSLKTQSLHLTQDLLIYRGKIDADLPVTDPDHLKGNIWMTQSLLVRKEQRFAIDSIGMDAGYSDSAQYLHIGGDMLNVLLQGHYKLTELGNVLQQSMQPYFSVMHDSSVKKLSPYDFTITANVYDRPIWKVILPDLTRLDSIYFTSHFADSGWKAGLAIPALAYGANQLDHFVFTAGTGGDSLRMKMTLDRLKSGSSIALDQTMLNAAIKNNSIDFALQIKDKTSKDKYRFSALLKQPRKDTYAFSLLPDQLLLNYNAWKISPSNSIEYSKSGVHVNQFVLSRGNQELNISSLPSSENGPVDVVFNQFRIATLTGFVQSDSMLADGILDGKITLSNITTRPSFTGDLKVRDFTVRKDTVGDIHVLVDNAGDNTLKADVSIAGRGNDVKLAGNYYIEPVNGSNFDMVLDIRHLALKSVEGPSMGKIRNASGELSGKISLQGTTDKPQVRGELNFQKAGLNVAMLNNYFYIDNDKVSIDAEGLHFNQFTIMDSSRNKLVLDGVARTADFKSYAFDLSLKSRNFRALNSRKRDNKLYYGKLYFNSNLTIRGTDQAPVVDGTIGVNDSTDMTIVLPQKEPGVEDRKGIVRFVDMKNLQNDSLFVSELDSLKTSSLRGMDVSVNITISKKAGFRLVIDEDNGDELYVKGEATLNAGIDLSGKINLTGSYELSEGYYELNFNVLHKKFNIQKESRITWTGEPTRANIDIKAIYIAQTSAMDLIQNQLSSTVSSTERNMYRQKLPFEVHLMMTGELLEPQIAFDIILPDDKNYQISSENINTIEARLAQIRTDPSELNKQVFALLLLGRFVGQNPFESSDGGTDAATLAKQSVSKILADQLNQLAGSLAWGVDINFDVASDQDYSSGTRQNRTDLNVSLSKRLLNDRLIVTVDSDFQLEGQNSNQQANNLAGNIAMDYQLSKDGRYMLRVYRKNNYQGIVEGYVIETGIGFIITIDYDRFKDIFTKKRPPKQNKKEQAPATGNSSKEAAGAVSTNQ